MFDIGNMPSTIDIGFTGEKNFRRIEINMAKWMVDMPNGVPSIVHIRPGETQADAYIAATTFEDNILTWTVTDGDLGSEEGIGIGQVWLEETENLTVNKRGKSIRFSTQIHGSINDASEVVPAAQAAWLEQMTALKTQTVTAAGDAEDAQEAAEAAQAAAEAAAASINNVIDDTAGDGDTDVTWSADKLVDEFADKADLSDIPDVSGKTDKVVSATNGNFAGLDSNGNLTDSGHKHSDYLTSHQDISGKLDKPATAGTSGQVLTSDGDGGQSWEDPTGGDPTEIIDDTAGAGDTDKVFSADKLTTDLSTLQSAITQGELEENLLRSEMPGTSTTVTMDSNGNPTSIVHTANSETVRTDSFVWGTGTVTETRTLANGKYITITTNLETLAQTISAVQEVA